MGRADEIERRLPLGLAVVKPVDESWVRVRLNAERLDWVPALIAGIDRPFVLESPAKLRDQMDDLMPDWRKELQARPEPQPHLMPNTARCGRCGHEAAKAPCLKCQEFTLERLGHHFGVTDDTTQE
jgi:hypothetical protein